MKKILFLFICMGFPVAFYGQNANLSKDSYCDFQTYAKALRKENPKAAVPEGYQLGEEIQTVTYEKFKFKYESILNKSGEFVGLFVTCIKIKRNNNKIRYAVIPITDQEDLIQGISYPMGMTMLGYFEKTNAVLLAKYIKKDRQQKEVIPK